MTKDISDLLKDWPATEGESSARVIAGDDGVELLQLRIDLGVLQMFFDGRPDGEKPFGQPSLLDHLLRVTESQSDAEFDSEMWAELDREVMQYYQRRRALLILGASSQERGDAKKAIDCFQRAVRDADHNLQVMDFIDSYCDDEDYVEEHERYRPFVLMHRTLAQAQSELLQSDPDEAVEHLKRGIKAIEEVYEKGDVSEMASQDPSLMQLRSLEEQTRKEHEIVQTLHEQLEAAVRDEEFEDAAELRDQLRAKRDAKRDATEMDSEA